MPTIYADQARIRSVLMLWENTGSATCGKHEIGERPWLGGEIDALNDGKAVFLAKMAVNTHGEGATVGVSKPTAYRGDMDAGLNAGRGEKVAEIVVGKVRIA